MMGAHACARFVRDPDQLRFPRGPGRTAPRITYHAELARGRSSWHLKRFPKSAACPTADAAGREQQHTQGTRHRAAAGTEEGDPGRLVFGGPGLADEELRRGFEDLDLENMRLLAVCRPAGNSPIAQGSLVSKGRGAVAARVPKARCTVLAVGQVRRTDVSELGRRQDETVRLAVEVLVRRGVDADIELRSPAPPGPGRGTGRSRGARSATGSVRRERFLFGQGTDHVSGHDQAQGLASLDLVLLADHQLHDRALANQRGRRRRRQRHRL